MLNRKERMEKLNNAGVNTGKYFTLDINENIPAGAKIHIVVDKDGNYVPEVVKENNDMKPTEGLRKFLDETYNEMFHNIIEDGYVRNTKLHRRFVMAQMFHMLNYVSYDGKHRGYNDCLKKMYGYEYTLNMMMEEVRVLSKLEVRDKESFNERSHFFTKEVVMAVLEDYIEKAIPDAVTLLASKGYRVNAKRVQVQRNADKKIEIPKDFVALLGVKLAPWKRWVTKMTEVGSTEYGMAMNRYTTPGNSRPMCYRDNNILVCVPDEAKVFEDVQEPVYPQCNLEYNAEYNETDGLAAETREETAVCYMTAALVCGIFEDDNAKKRLSDIATNMLE